MNIFETTEKYADGAKILAEWIGVGAHPVPYDTAQGRANICLVCPENKPGAAVTEAVAKAIKRVVEIKNSMKLRVLGEKELHTCQICMCPVKLKIHVPTEKQLREIPAGELDKYPNHCWLKKERHV